MGALLVLVLLTLELSVVEFVELQGLSDDARRSRLSLPTTCTPRLGAIAPAAPPTSPQCVR